MIIRCPECSTGFKLQDERIGTDPMKVRCSRCSHVFRVGLEEGEPVRYTESGERLPDPDASSDPGTRRKSADETRFGGPGRSESSNGASASEAAESTSETDGEGSSTANPNETQLGGPAPQPDAGDETSSPEETHFGSPGGSGGGEALGGDATEPPSDADGDPNETRHGVPSTDGEPSTEPKTERNEASSGTMLGGPTSPAGDDETAAARAGGPEASPDERETLDDSQHAVSDTPAPEEAETPPPGQSADSDAAGRRTLDRGGPERTRSGTPGPDESSADAGGNQTGDTGSADGEAPGGAQVLTAGGDADADDESQTSGETSGSSESASADYDPFPHAGEDVQPDTQRAISDDGEDSTAEESDGGGDSTDDDDLELFDEDAQSSPSADEAFEDTFDDLDGAEESSPPAGGLEAPSKGPGDSSAPAAERDPLAVDSGAGASQSSPEEDMSSLEIGDEGLPQDDDSFQAQRSEQFQETEESGPDMRARADVETFDPSGGGDSAPELNEPPATASAPPEDSEPEVSDKSGGGAPGEGAPGGGQGPPPDQRSAPRSDRAETSAPGPASSEAPDPSPAGDEASSPSSASSPPSDAAGHASAGSATGTSRPSGASWDSVDEVDRIDNAAYESSGLRKVANLALIVLLVGNAFLAFVAAQNSWFIDFSKFDQMLSVAFQNGTYTPRDAWSDGNQEETKPPPLPVDPIQFESVFAQRIELGGDGSESARDGSTLLVVKGKAENVGRQDFETVRVRGLIRDATGRVLTQKTAPLGNDVPLSELKGLDDPETLGSLLSETPKGLKRNESQPFTIVFETLPDEVRKEGDVHYAVEVADTSGGSDDTGGDSPSKP